MLSAFPDHSSHHEVVANAITPSVDSQLHRIWQELVSGRSQILNRDTLPDYHCLEIGIGREPRPAGLLTATKLSRLFRLLLGQSQKVLAAETGAAPSTIAMQLGDCLQAFGLHRRSHRVPLLLVVMAHVIHGRLSPQHVRLERRVCSEGESWLVQCRRPELSLGLSHCEGMVVTSLVAGDTYLEIARQRKTSPRTIANQIANAYAKLNVSGRSELLGYLASTLGGEATLPTEPDCPPASSGRPRLFGHASAVVTAFPETLASGAARSGAGAMISPTPCLSSGRPPASALRTRPSLAVARSYPG